MMLLFRRYRRSNGYTGTAFYTAVALGFVALAIWAVVEMDWLVMSIAIAMIAATVAGSRIMRRLSEARAASERELRDRKERGG